MLKIYRIATELAEEQGETISQNVHHHIEELLRKATEANTLTTPSEVATSRMALIGAAVQAALGEQAKQVGVRHLKQGWLKYLAYGGNCPPHECLFRSVIQREAVLRTTLPVFDLLKLRIEE
ncbi:MAG TPA: hypothetical protein VNJ70_14225 [Thermoanaerobaculia bacterium]|nr:hypothetical protein [Thermoanaerobaculia bacterium]